MAGLKGVWEVHLESATQGRYRGEAQPLVYQGVVYVISAADDVVAIEVKSGRVIWKYEAHLDPEINTVCCVWTSRGVALGEGKIYVGQLDGRLVALDQGTGEPLWSTQVEKWQEGYTITSAPLYYNGLVITGISGGEFGIRGKSPPTMPKTAGWYGVFIPSPDLVSSAMRPGLRTLTYGKRARLQCGRLPLWTRLWACFIFLRAILARTITGVSVPGTTCLPPPSWPWRLKRASTDGTSRRSTTTFGTMMPPIQWSV